MKEAEVVKCLNAMKEKLRDNSQVQELYGISISALEKQIPKKIVQAFGSGEGCYCPYCGNGVNKNYCGKCGQRLDWE